MDKVIPNQKILTVKEWIIILFISFIPVVNIIMWVIWLISTRTNINLKNYIKANLILWLLVIFVNVILFVGLTMIEDKL